MAKQPFNQQGLSAKLSELYNQSDSALQISCTAAAADFRKWLKDNFILDSDQIAYIDELPQKLNAFYGWRIASVLICRGSISMGVLPTEHRRTKETNWTDSCNVDYIPPRSTNPYQLNMAAQGSLTFKAP